MEKIKLLLYCCKNKKQLFYDTISQRYMVGLNGKNDNFNSLNGYIVAECDFEVEEITTIKLMQNETDYDLLYETSILRETELLKQSCLKYQELDDYLESNNGYAIHIKNLKERIMELSDCAKYTQDNILYGGKYFVPVDKAPQNMMRVWVFENGKWVMYILISVRPEWMCLILNKEKDVEVRKKVLKEMITDA